MGLAPLHYQLSRVAQKRGLWMACLSLFLAGCASAPQVAEKSASQFNDRTPAASPLMSLASSQPDSGIRLLADPSEALQSRLHLAALATATLDIQYYLGQGDNSGLGPYKHHGAVCAYAEVDACRSRAHRAVLPARPFV